MAKIASGREVKGRFPRKPRACRSSVALQQHSGPIRLTACPFSGPLKAAGKLILAPSIIPTDAVGKKKRCFDANEPSSPEVTCLGRVRIKEKNGKDLDGTVDENPSTDGRKFEPDKFSDSKKQSGDRKGKARKKKKAAEKGRCLSRTRRRASREATEPAQVKGFCSALPAAVPPEITQTRRERAATLARSLTSLLEDLRRLEKEEIEYVPPVPPPNSLLLMRGCRKVEKPPEQVSVSQLKMNNTTMADEYGIKKNTMVEHVHFSEIKVKSRNSLAEHFSLSEIKMERDTMAEISQVKDTMAAQVKYTIAQQDPLCKVENNAMDEHIPPSKMVNKSMDQVSPLEEPLGATLWQRRAIAKLASIEITKPIKREVRQPTTKLQRECKS